MGRVADGYRYRQFTATAKSTVAEASSRGYGGSGIFRVGEKTVKNAECLLTSRRSESIVEAFEERAAILEHDGGMSREEAERLARRLTGYEGA